MELYNTVLLVVLVVIAVVFHRQIDDLRGQLRQATDENDHLTNLVRDLLRRVYTLEQNAARPTTPPAPQLPPEPVVQPHVGVLPPQPQTAYSQPPASIPGSLAWAEEQEYQAELARRRQAEFASAGTTAYTDASASEHQPFQHSPGTFDPAAPIHPEAAAPQPPSAPTDWEAVLGGNVLNKIGGLVLVVGIALFLGYSVTMLGPAGKVAIGLLIGAAMLVAGILLEQRERYQTFGRGLIGAGWAAVYFTTYAAFDLPAARIIYDPTLGTALLLGVSAAMIGHSMLYRREEVTSLAYFIGFVSILVSPLTSFSLVATLVLALALLATAYRNAWRNLGLAGVFLTYATLIARYDIAIAAQPGLLNMQSLLWIYWLAFEGADLLHRRRGDTGITASLYFWVNAGGFLLGTIGHTIDMGVRGSAWSPILAAVAAAFAASAVIRFFLDRPAEERADFLPQLVSGGYGSATVISTAFALWWTLARHEGYAATLVMLLIAELLVVGGVLLQQPFLRTLGAVAHVAPLLHWLDVDYGRNEQIPFGPLKLHGYSYTGIVLALTWVVNRIWLKGLWFYGTAAMAVVSILIDAEMSRPWGTVAWAILASSILIAGGYLNKSELRVQGYFLAAITFFRALGLNLETDRVVTIILIAGLFYAAYWLTRPYNENWDLLGRTGVNLIATVLVAALLAVEVQGRLLTVSLGLEGTALLAVGFLLRDRLFRLSGLVLFLLCIAKLFFYDLNSLDTLSRIFSFIILGLLLLGASFVYTRFRDQMKKLL
jgi:uncharacterized membrane protein